MKARIRGAQTHMQQFGFIFGSVLGLCLFQPVDSLSASFQIISLSAADAQQNCSNDCLCCMRNYNEFSLFWKTVVSLAIHRYINLPFNDRGEPLLHQNIATLQIMRIDRDSTRHLIL